MVNLLKKINRSDGFTLAETLAAVLIMLLASAVMAAGIPAAVNAYNKAVDAANAQVLLSTTVSALRDELSTAWDVEVSADNKTVTYKSSDTGLKSKIFLNPASDNIEIQEFENWDSSFLDPADPGSPAVTKPSSRPLVSEAIRGRVRGSTNMIVTYSHVDKNSNIIAISGLTVVVKQSGQEDRTVAKLPDDGSTESVLKIRVLG